jgi:enterochelin esterase-like enzyme
MRRRRASLRLLAITAAAAIVGLGTSAAGAETAAEKRGTIEHIRVHGPSLEGNLQGNSPERDVLVYLPPSYESEPDRRYPVVYQLHGWMPGAEQYAGMLNLQEGTDRAIASGAAREMIVVVPDGQTVHGGGMYSSSVTTGDFEAFIARDLVDYIDRNYRTIPERASRGLSGHSMGGYGTLRIGMKYPELYSSIYAMSSCCLSPRGVDQAVRQAAELTTMEEAASAGVGPRVVLTLAAAWSPNPDRPPFYFDLPVQGGEVQPLIVAKWAANAPLAMLDQYVLNLRRLEAIAIDIGLQDGLIRDNEAMSKALNAYGIPHTYETYEGDHVNRVAERYATRVLPFFSRELAFEPSR